MSMPQPVLDRIVSTLSATSRRLAWAELALCRALIALFTVLLIVNVTLRYAFNSPLFFAEELAVYILIWMAFLAISVSIHEDGQIRLTLLTDALPKAVQAPVRLIAEAVVAVMLAVLFVRAMGWITSPAVDFELAITLGLPKWPFFTIIPLFLGAAFIHVLARLLAEGRDALVGRPLHGETTR